MKNHIQLNITLLFLCFGLSILHAQQADCSMTGLLVDYKTSPTGTFAGTPTRTICQLPGFYESKPNISTNIYGSRTDKQTTATGYYYVEQINGRWWVVDPHGYLSICRAVNCLAKGSGTTSTTAYSSLYANSSVNWMNSAKQMLNNNGFFCAGAWSDITNIKNNPNQSTKPLAYTIILNLMSGYASTRAYQQAGHMGYPNNAIFVFESAFSTYCDTQAQALAANKTDANLFGYFTDNELPFYSSNLNGFLAIGRTSPTDENYLATLNWLTTNGHTAADTTSSVVQGKFLAFEAKTYYSIVYNAIKKYDPNHMVIGSRVNQTDTRNNSYFMQAVGPYVDLFSANLYSTWTPSISSSVNWGTNLSKPFIVSEFYTKGSDVGYSNTGGAGWIVRTQLDRGYEYQNFVLSLLESKYCVGWHWFKYMDNDSTVAADPSNIDANKGIVNLAYVPYTAMTDKMKELNVRVYNLIDYFDQQPTPTTLYPEADGYYKGSVWYGTDDRIGIKNTTAGSSVYREAFLRFDLTGQTSNIGSANLHLSVLSSAEGGINYKAEICGDTWTENVTPPSHPAASSEIGRWVNSIDPNMDVKSVLVSKINATSTKLSIKLSGIDMSTGALEYASRENTSVALRPHIDISQTLAGPVAATNLVDLFIQNYRLSTFNPDTLNYKITLPTSTATNPIIQYTKANNSMTVTLSGPVNVSSNSVADRTATLYTTSADGLQHRTYTLVFDKVLTQITTVKDTVRNEQGISCYPNPIDGNSILNVESLTKNTRENMLTVADISGKLITQTSFYGSKYKLQLLNIESGMYLAYLSNSNGRFVEKLMVR